MTVARSESYLSLASDDCLRHTGIDQKWRKFNSRYCYTINVAFTEVEANLIVCGFRGGSMYTLLKWDYGTRFASTVAEGTLGRMQIKNFRRWKEINP